MRQSYSVTTGRSEDWLTKAEFSKGQRSQLVDCGSNNSYIGSEVGVVDLIIIIFHFELVGG